MFQGNWTCSKCGGTITQLPFEPKSNAGLTCRDCYFNTKNGDAAGAAPAPASDVDTGASGGEDDRDIPDFDPDEAMTAAEPAPESPDIAEAPAATGEKQMFEGDWKCAGCGAAITSLPFKPFNTENLKCLDCFKKA